MENKKVNNIGLFSIFHYYHTSIIREQFFYSLVENRFNLLNMYSQLEKSRKRKIGVETYGW